MKILMLAWRDMKHSSKGGAEIITDIYLSHLAKNKNNNVTLFSSSFKGADNNETYHNYNIIRKGNKLSVYLKGLIYAYKHKNEFDIIIDQVNTIPFFTPLLIPRNKRIALIHQLCKNVWFYETKFPISVIGYFLESIYLKLYRNTHILTISRSTKRDLIKHCWAKPKNIFVSESQLDFQPLKSVQKKQNQFIYVGRLKRSKRVHHVIKAFNIIKSNNFDSPIVKDLKLYIIGKGDKSYKKYLDKLIKKFNLSESVIFTGAVSKEQRNKLMSESKAIIVPSVREGWGLIVSEANANGTLAITYDVEGLRDANKEGLITDINKPDYLAREMIKLLRDNAMMLKLSKSSLEDSRLHTNWERQCREVERWMKEG